MKKIIVLILTVCLLILAFPMTDRIEATNSTTYQFSGIGNGVDPPSSTPQPQNYFPIVITAVISAIVVTIVGLIAASLKGLFKNRQNQKMVHEEKNLLDEIERATTSDELRSLRKKLASEKAMGSIDKERFDFLLDRIDQRFEELQVR